MTNKNSAATMTIAEFEQITGQKYEPEEDMSVEEYLDVYRKVLTLSMDADGFGLFEMITERDIKKAKIIRAIMDILDDVPRRRMKHIINYKKVDYDVDEIEDMAFSE